MKYAKMQLEENSHAIIRAVDGKRIIQHNGLAEEVLAQTLEGFRIQNKLEVRLVAARTFLDCMPACLAQGQPRIRRHEHMLAHVHVHLSVCWVTCRARFQEVSEQSCGPPLRSTLAVVFVRVSLEWSLKLVHLRIANIAMDLNGEQPDFEMAAPERQPVPML